MNYLGYVVAAYAVFFVFLLWDFLVPWLRARKIVRAARLRAIRATSRPPTSGTP